ncbi:hypothetical protein ANN_12648 [Periplaneta americana]|uniref:HAT C-terminal dimerisation domain-containing protein n=1 Tax=Periplaneta americana TaxID=6978 RepID=A0ABQ8THS2_PERAM|nr:hypothetical protein ANN_12648 [Periplaneta americana]
MPTKCYFENDERDSKRIENDERDSKDKSSEHSERERQTLLLRLTTRFTCVNDQNFRYWSGQNPPELHEKPLHNDRVTVWCAVARVGILGPYFFEEDGATVTVNSQRYSFMINNNFWHQDSMRCRLTREDVLPHPLLYVQSPECKYFTSEAEGGDASLLHGQAGHILRPSSGYVGFELSMLEVTEPSALPSLKEACVRLVNHTLPKISHPSSRKSIQTFVPKNIVRASDEDLEPAVEAIVNQWPNDVDVSPESFFNELKMWRRNFLDQKNLHPIPTDFISSLNRCNEIIFPFTRKALKFFCTLPVTTATPERSFSTLRYLKTYLRSTMGADRLNGLALMYIHKNVAVKLHEVLDEMSKKPRRLVL